MRLILWSIFMLIGNQGFTQVDPDVIVEISADSIYMDNAFRLKYVVINGAVRDLQQPDMANFDLLQGPSRSTSISIINGIRSSEESYTYYYRPIKPGVYTIPSITFNIDDANIKSKEIEVVIVPNPEGWHQDPNTGHIEGRPLKKKQSSKRKRYRI